MPTTTRSGGEAHIGPKNRGDRWSRSTPGQGLVEYALLLVLLAIVVTGGATLLGGGLAGTYDVIAGALGGTPGPTTSPGQPTPTATMTPSPPTTVTVRVIDDTGNGLAGVPVNAFFGDQDHYTELTYATDGGGYTTFSLPDGTYFFRADYLGNVYWSAGVVTPGDTATTIQTTVCQEITLGDVTFPDKGNPLDGLQVIVHVENNSGLEKKITQVTLDWKYLRNLPEEPKGHMRLFAVYFCPGKDSSCNVAAKDRFFNTVNPGWKSDLNATTSPTTVKTNPQVLPTNGGYLGFDFDSLDKTDKRSFADAPWKLAASDFGFEILVEGCPKPITRAAVAR